jgi:hypothetical protein
MMPIQVAGTVNPEMDDDHKKERKMKFKANAILMIMGLTVLGICPVTAQDEALYIDEIGNVGLGLNTPARQLHLKGANAVFRMDRSTDAAAFMIVRTSPEGNPLKNFVVGTIASGANNGEFIINDLGTAVAGGGVRRMTITNQGDVIFTGAVRAANFVTPSSRRLKENIEHLVDPIALTQQLSGIRFDWKENGQTSLGFIAEEVAQVLPEVVSYDEDNGQAVGLNYAAIVPVLVEAVKEQQKQIEVYETRALKQEAELTALKEQMNEFQAMKVRFTEIEKLIADSQPRMLLVHN